MIAKRRFVSGKTTIDEDSAVWGILRLRHCSEADDVANRSQQASEDSHVLSHRLFHGHANHGHLDYFLCRLDHGDHTLDRGGNHVHIESVDEVGRDVTEGLTEGLTEGTALHSLEPRSATAVAGLSARSLRDDSVAMMV